jgi:demethylmenaquinone methyltransferase/2-methoxy-6-polyprenyl-1,4-benzoquinol methylase
LVFLPFHLKHTKVALPYSNSDKNKKEQVKEMFDAIAPKYDFLNHALSLQIDKYWRSKLVKFLRPCKPMSLLDVAAGTGDMSIALAKLKPRSIIGFDLSKGMLAIGKQKVSKCNLDNVIQMVEGDAEAMPFDSNSFDAVTAAFGVRNFEHTVKGLSEMCRVLKPGGKLAVLEFSTPRNSLFSKIFLWYFRNILPAIGKLISHDSSAYTYLPLSVSEFANREDFTAMLKEAGFINASYKEYTFGVVCLYMASKA